MIRYFRKTTLLLSLVVVSTLVAFGDDPDGPPNPGGDPSTGGGVPVGAPVDGGISLFLLLSTGYGIYRISLVKKKEQSVSEEVT
jgi:hypothetical protein